MARKLKESIADKLRAAGFKDEDIPDIAAAFDDDDDDAGGAPPARGRKSNGGGSGRVVVIEGDEARSFLDKLGFGSDDAGDGDGDDGGSEPDDKPKRTGNRWFDD